MMADLREALGGLGDRFAELREHGLSDLWALVLASFAVFGAVAWVGSMATRVYGRTPPRYAVPTPLGAQGGVAGHAAQLGAPTTRPAFALIENQSTSVAVSFAPVMGRPEVAGFAVAEVSLASASGMTAAQCLVPSHQVPAGQRLTSGRAGSQTLPALSTSTLS